MGVTPCVLLYCDNQKYVYYNTKVLEYKKKITSCELFTFLILFMLSSPKKDGGNFMVQIDKNDLEDVLMDLDGILDLLTVVESSEYYEKQDAGVFHGIRNSLQYTKDRLEDITKNANSVELALK